MIKNGCLWCLFMLFSLSTVGCVGAGLKDIMNNRFAKIKPVPPPTEIVGIWKEDQARNVANRVSRMGGVGNAQVYLMLNSDGTGTFCDFRPYFIVGSAGKWDKKPQKYFQENGVSKIISEDGSMGNIVSNTNSELTLDAYGFNMYFEKADSMPDECK